MTQLKAENRVVWVDWLRVAACFMVIIVHATEPFYLGGEGSQILTEADAYWSSLFDSFVRACVPLFVVASSYLQFPLHYSSGEFLRRRAVRILVPFALWSVVYALVWGEPADNFQNLLFNFNYAAGHLWFVYMLIGVYIAMPLLSPWVERVSKRGEQIFIAAWAVTTLVPFLHQAALALFGRAEVYGEANWNEFGTLYYISGFIGYVVLAHYIRTYIDWSWKKTLAVALPMWIVGYAVAAAWFWLQIPTEYPVNESIDLAVLMEQSWRFCSTSVAMTAVAMFLIFKKINCSGVVYRNIIQPISKVSYGIYLMHMFALVAIFAFVPAWGMATPWTIVTIATLTFILCSVVAVVISKLPGGKYIVG